MSTNLPDCLDKCLGVVVRQQMITSVTNSPQHREREELCVDGAVTFAGGPSSKQIVHAEIGQRRAAPMLRVGLQHGSVDPENDRGPQILRGHARHKDAGIALVAAGGQMRDLGLESGGIKFLNVDSKIDFGQNVLICLERFERFAKI